MFLFRRILTFCMIAMLMLFSATDSSAYPRSSKSTTCMDVTLDNDTTSSTCTVFIGNSDKVTIVLNAVMDWTDSDPDLDLDLKVEISNSESGTFYDINNLIDSTGVDSPVSSVISLALSSGDTDTTHEKQWYIPMGFTAQYIKLTATATNSDEDDTVVLNVFVMTQE